MIPHNLRQSIVAEISGLHATLRDAERQQMIGDILPEQQIENILDQIAASIAEIARDLPVEQQSYLIRSIAECLSSAGVRCVD